MNDTSKLLDMLRTELAVAQGSRQAPFLSATQDMAFENLEKLINDDTRVRMAIKQWEVDASDEVKAVWDNYVATLKAPGR